MCSRFFRAEITWSVYADEMGVTPLAGIAPPDADWNAAPGTHHPIIRTLGRTSQRELAPCYWGLVPSWWTKPLAARKFSGISVPFSEAPHRPVYRGGFRYRHCLVPVSGYYFWSGDGKARLPFAVGPPATSSYFCLAGLWDSALIDGSVIESFTILTTTPNDALAGLTTQMPVIVPPAHYALWLDAKASQDTVFAPLAVDDMHVWPADPAVGNVRNNYPELVGRP